MIGWEEFVKTKQNKILKLVTLLTEPSHILEIQLDIFVLYIINSLVLYTQNTE